jgi:hypothetical protein
VRHVMILLLLQAVELMQKRNYNAAECSRLVAQLLAYVLGRAPFCLECPSGMPVSNWWASMPMLRPMCWRRLRRCCMLSARTLPIQSASSLSSGSMRGTAAPDWLWTLWA